jgi:hypothetical protein
MTDNRAVHIIDLLQRLLNVFDTGILKVLLGIRSDTAAILVGVLQMQGNTAAAVTALNNIIALIEASNTDLANIDNILNQISTELQNVKANLDTLVQQGSTTYNALLVLINKVEDLKVSQETFYAAILKYEDAVAVTGDAGISVLTVRQDTLSSTTSNTGDYIQPSADLYGRIHVNTGGVPVLRTDILVNTPSAGITRTYVGWALPGTLDSAATWKIMRMEETVATGSLTITWGGGVMTHTNIWNNRAALSYN